MHQIPAIHPGNKTGELTRLYAAQKIEHRLAGFRRFALRIEVGIPSVLATYWISWTVETLTPPIWIRAVRQS